MLPSRSRYKMVFRSKARASKGAPQVRFCCPFVRTLPEEFPNPRTRLASGLDPLPIDYTFPLFRNGRPTERAGLEEEHCHQRCYSKRDAVSEGLTLSEREDLNKETGFQRGQRNTYRAYIPE
ncbi:hypothetical protein NPIL_597361 [Nephila pilipes]|uniref:Uncharacterized protein n=1 Tax=Nephila pilipes TaxID=299642 RepID=A0A8X6Q859_NEPPI|nr:hypothetical protein NPIL_597361 [Nephila pilipes]